MLTTGIADQRLLYATLGEASRLAYLDAVRPGLAQREDTCVAFARQACQATNAELCAITFVEADRVSILGSFGWTSLPDEKALSDAICAHTAALTKAITLKDARRDELFRTYSLVRALGVVGYLGVPIPADGKHAWGTLCVLDRRLRTWDTAQRNALMALSAQIHGAVETPRAD